MCCELIFNKHVKAVVPVPFVLEGTIGRKFCEKMNLNTYLILYIKINSKLIIYLNIKHNTIKLKRDIGKTFLKEIGIKAKLNKWDLIKLTSFSTAKETINKKTNYRL